MFKYIKRSKTYKFKPTKIFKNDEKSKFNKYIKITFNVSQFAYTIYFHNKRFNNFEHKAFQDQKPFSLYLYKIALKTKTKRIKLKTETNFLDSLSFQSFRSSGHASIPLSL